MNYADKMPGVGPNYADKMPGVGPNYADKRIEGGPKRLIKCLKMNQIMLII